ncbi:intraflagellar transport protein 25 homolog isoform X1 [Fukomys damarensis]|uniref:intraflagellar transport protein 25 homolog isoform X1 n=1 Tax=Fukomys damarensis TaxID=885580 RepID=UPI0008FF23AE|nr:intraflagellar transport protein 25 homolog isoform X1 [Fukomys damarensis]
MRKADLCLSSEGAEVILATSSDEKHPPENIIDGNAETFWTTTGMFPQEFIICFHKHVKIEKIIIQSYLVRTLRVEKSTSKEPVGFEQWIEKDLVHTEGQLQNEEIMHRPFGFLIRTPTGPYAELQAFECTQRIPSVQTELPLSSTPDPVDGHF